VRENQKGRIGQEKVLVEKLLEPNQVRPDRRLVTIYT